MLAVFHTGWFVESLWSQTLVIHMIRAPKISFIHSRVSWQLALLTTLSLMVRFYVSDCILLNEFKNFDIME
jgi:Mg2+-importing ATPase